MGLLLRPVSNIFDHPIRLAAGLDTGLSSGGLVVLDRARDDRVLEAVSLVEPKGAARTARAFADAQAETFGGWSDREFLAAQFRALRWMDMLTEALDRIENEHGRIDMFGIESFVDQRSRAREEKQQLLKNRWMTPLTMGMLAAELDRRDYTIYNGRVVYQNAGIVIRQMSEEIARLKARPRGGTADLIVRGDHKVTNDHLRKAFAHGLALSMRLPAYTAAVA
jgi:hypothetical protein